MNLKGTVMHRAIMRAATLNWMILKEIDLSDSDLRNAKFNAAFLQNVALSRNQVISRFFQAHNDEHLTNACEV
jgi:uncharacterized protein YjbI with pentapeptide repeats